MSKRLDRQDVIRFYNFLLNNFLRLFLRVAVLIYYKLLVASCLPLN